MFVDVLDMFVLDMSVDVLDTYDTFDTFDLQFRDILDHLSLNENPNFEGNYILIFAL